MNAASLFASRRSIATRTQVGRNLGASMPSLQAVRTVLQREATRRHFWGQRPETTEHSIVVERGPVFQKQKVRLADLQEDGDTAVARQRERRSSNSCSFLGSESEMFATLCFQQLVLLMFWEVSYLDVCCKSGVMPDQHVQG
jgi:hypothetical protein